MNQAQHWPAELGLALATAGSALLVLPALGPGFESARTLCLLLGVALCAWRCWERPALGGLLPWIAGLALLPALLAALGLGLAPDLALWGSVERGQGMLVDLALLLLLLLGGPLLVDPQRQRRWLRVVAGSLIVACLCALLQAFGWGPVDSWLGPAERSAATFGNPTQAANWLLLAWPALCLLWWKRRDAIDPPLVLAGLLLLPLALWFSGSRAALPALLAGIALLGWGQRLRWPQLLGGVLALLLLVLALSHWRADSTAVRADLLRAAGAAAIDPPPLQDAAGRADRLRGWRWLLGYGPDGSESVLAARLPEGPAQSGRPDRAHQLWLDVWLSRGLLGIVALLAAVGWLGWRWQSGEANSHWSARLPFVALLGWGVALQLSFPLTADKALAVLWLGWLAAPLADRPADERGSLLGGLAVALLLPALLIGFGRTPPAQLRRAEEAGRLLYLQGLAEQRPVSALRTLAESERAFLQASRIAPFQADLALARMTVAVTIAGRVQPARAALCGLADSWPLIEADPVVAAQAGPARERWEALRECPGGGSTAVATGSQR